MKKDGEKKLSHCEFKKILRHNFFNPLNKKIQKVYEKIDK